MSETENYLKQMVEFRKTMNLPNKKPHYLGAEDFVLREGRQYEVDYSALNRYGVGKMKHCYSNAFDLVSHHPDLNLTYIEGFASTVIPVLHAWVVDKDGLIADVTWEMKDRKKEFYPTGYYGVAFSQKQCWEVMNKSGQYGLLDAWQAGWPLFKKKFKREVDL